MKQALQFVLSGLALWLGAKFFPQYIMVGNIVALLFANTVLFVGMTAILALCFFALTPPLHRDMPVLALAITMLIIAIFGGAGVLMIMSSALYDFWIANYWVALVISFIAGMPSLTVNLRKSRF